MYLHTSLSIHLYILIYVYGNFCAREKVEIKKIKTHFQLPCLPPAGMPSGVHERVDSGLNLSEKSTQKGK